jgi:hypothetical protein
MLIPRLLKVALLTAMVFMGVTLFRAGVHFWSAAHRSTTTLFDTLPAAADEDSVRIDPDPLFDRTFIMERIGAAVVVVLGVSLLYLASVMMKRKERT